MSLILITVGVVLTYVQIFCPTGENDCKTLKKTPSDQRTEVYA